MPDPVDTRLSDSPGPDLTALLVDQQSCWRQGLGVPVEDYLDHHPWLRGNDEALLHLILHEVMLRSQAGETPALAEYQRRFPHLAEQLAVQFEVERAIAGETGLSLTDLHERASLALTVPGIPPSPELPATPSIPGYEVLEKLGQGGMGVVYRARQTKLDRIVALKMILPRSATLPVYLDALLERLRSEAAALAQLQHPDIVQIFELGECNGLPYLALEYVPGSSLGRRLAGGAKLQPAAEAGALVERLARAMHAAHGCGVLHRDLKPDNILLGSDGSPKIGDFGLAKRLDGKPGLTASGMLLGTPSYMAPEQAEGRNSEVGVAADVYALGAILYACLTGRPPFRAATVMETLYQVKMEEPVRPRQLEPAVPRDLETICLKCLEKRPQRRYPSAEALADDLRRFLEHRPILARRAGLLEQGLKWARRRPAAATLLAVSVLAGLALSVLAVVADRAARGEREARQQEARERARRAAAQVESLLSAEPGDVPRLLTLLAEQRDDVPGQHASEMGADLWRRFDAPASTAGGRLRLLAALAALDPQSPRWQQVSGQTLAELILQADPGSLAVLLPVLGPYCQRDLTLFRREVEGVARSDWHDPPLDPAWSTPASGVRQQVEQAGGLLAERFALVQTLPLERLAALVDELRRGGYRPLCCRPYRVGRATRVAAVWTRDGRAVRLLHSVSAEQVRRQDETNRREGYQPIDVTGWLAPGEPVSSCHAALWVRSQDQTHLYVGVPEERHQEDGWGPPQQAGLQPLTAHSLYGADGARRYSSIWGRVATSRSWPSPNYWIDELDYEHRLTPDRIQLYADVRPTPRQTPQEHARAQLRRDEAALKRNPADRNALYRRGVACSRLGDDRRALQDLDAYLKAVPSSRAALAERAFVLARLGRADSARKDLGVLRRHVSEPGKVVPIEALLAVYLGEEVAWSALDNLVRSSRDHPDVLFEAAVVHAQAGRPHRDRAVALLGQALAAGLARTWDVRMDLRLAPLHDHPGYQALLERFHPDREYGAVWYTGGDRESAESHGLAPAAHLARCRQLAAAGYRPVSLSVAETRPGKTLTTASVWQRPVVAERAREIQSPRQASAGLALLKLGRAEAVWPLLKHSAYPETRSRLVLGLAPAGVDVRVVVERLEGEADASIRQALILALGGYSAAALPPELRQRLLYWYRDDPDPGIHGAIDWLLRRRAWQHDARASRERPENAARRWYVNGQGQTLVMVDGQAPFLMGSPVDELGHQPDEALHWRRIGHCYALGAKLVTVAEFRRFLKSHPEVKHDHDESVGPTPDCPANNVTWYLAAQYCRWLSEQEGVPEGQMVYPPVKVIERCKDSRAPLRLPADYLKRTGYRLPTEAEWEHACRAGARTSNYFGSSGDLFRHYAWYAGNSRKRTWPVGQKRPNDLGLFDMHGNVWTWCQEGYAPYPAGTVHWPAQDAEDAGEIADRPQRVLRGGSFALRPLGVRSAHRADGQRPSDRRSGFGLRVARTLP